MVIREIISEDAEKFVHLIKQVEGESDFMLMEPFESEITPNQQRKHLERMAQQDNSTIFVAEQNEGKLVGFMVVIGGNARRTKHCAYLVIGILKEYRRQRIGNILFERVEEWAIKLHILRLELSVVTKNIAGIGLYKKQGFVIEGTKRKSIMIDGTPHNEYFMSKLLQLHT